MSSALINLFLKSLKARSMAIQAQVGNYHWLITIGVLIVIFHINCSSDQEDWKKAERLIPMKEYTEDNTREWEELKTEHIPVVRKSLDKGKESILIELPKLSSSYGHYIESFGIMDEDGILIASKMNERSINPLRYAYFPWDASTNKKRLRAFAKCNLHDTWVQEFDTQKIE